MKKSNLLRIKIVRIYVIIMNEKSTLAALRLFLLGVMGHSPCGRHARSAKKIEIFNFSVTFFHKFILLSKDLI